MKHTSTRRVSLIAQNDDDVLCRVAEPSGVRLKREIIDAQCIRIEGPTRFRRYEGSQNDKSTRQRWGLVFHFRAVEPPHEGVRLQMYVRYNPSWTYLPRSSKLLQCVRVALAGQRRPDVLIRKSWFLGKVFRVRLRETAGPDPYTVVDSLLEKMA